MPVIGFGEYRPAQPNETAAGRDANRRVVIVILAGEGTPAPSDAAGVVSQAGEGNAAGNDAGLPVPALPADALPSDVQSTESNPPPVNDITQPTTASGTEPAPLPMSTGAGAGIPAQE